MGVSARRDFISTGATLLADERVRRRARVHPCVAVSPLSGVETSSGARDVGRVRFADYESARAMFEVWNAIFWQDTSALRWMFDPAWQADDYDLDDDHDGAYFGSRKGSEALHVQANPATWRVLAANHTTDKVIDATITAKVYDPGGRQFCHIEQQGVDILPSSAVPGFAVCWPSAPPLQLVRLELRDRDGALLSENAYWRYSAPQGPRRPHMSGLDTLAATCLGLSVRVVDRGRLVATVANEGDTLAAMVRLALHDRAGARLTPTRYEANYFWLLPGESREIPMAWPLDATATKPAYVSAQAYNAPARTAPKPCAPVAL
jgi:Exo-beta-D-glucosaminidase Ig-fold domain